MAAKEDVMGDAIAATNAHTNTNMTATVLIATSATAPASPAANAVPTAAVAAATATATPSTGIMSVRQQKWDTMFEKDEILRGGTRPL